MRLLNVSTHALEDFFEPHVPPYMILSHRWEDEEVLFNDIAINNYKYKKGFKKIESVFGGANYYKQKKGFKKLELVCQAAIEADIIYVWIDTCCIDKSSSAELSEAINSMFKWYQNSRFCYAYLSDIEFVSGDEDITKSVWFERGWTLQELIAPNVVVFYDQAGRRIGSRDLLSSQISRKTRVPEKILSGMLDSNRILAEFTAAQKMSWAAGRQTTRIEDRAYSLIGIFDVSMPLLYGEGIRAFVRLQEEILRTGTDLSILSWLWIDEESSNLRTNLLAMSPDEFCDCEDIVKSFPAPGVASEDNSFVMTNQGLRIERPPMVVLPSANDDMKFALSLGCRKSSDINGVLALKIQVTGSLAISKTSVKTEKKVCHVGWLSNTIAWDSRLVRVIFFEPVVLSDWSTLTISKRRTDLQGQKYSDISTHPHKHLWLLPPANDTWTTWRALSHWPPIKWNQPTMTYALESSDRENWKFASIAFGSDLGEGFFVHMKCSAKSKIVLSVLMACDLGRNLDAGGKSIPSIDLRLPDSTDYRTGDVVLDISPKCRIKVLPQHLSRYDETILQLQIRVERPERIPAIFPIEAAAYPDVPTRLPPVDYSNFSRYFRMDNEINKPKIPAGKYTLTRYSPRTIDSACHELDSKEIDLAKCIQNLQDAYTLYSWRTPQCIRNYVTTVLLSINLVKNPTKSQARFHGYVGVRHAQRDRMAAEPAEMAGTVSEEQLTVDHNLYVSNLDELPFYPSEESEPPTRTEYSLHCTLKGREE